MEETLKRADKALKNKEFDDAVELYGDACAVYSKEHDGEDDPDLLFKYGKALFQLAVSNSTLLNADAVDKQQLPMAVESDENFKFAPTEEAADGAATTASDAASKAASAEPLEGGEEAASGETDEAKDDAAVASDDENVEGEDGDDGDAPGEEDEEDEDDDFTAAWKILDVVRVLFEKQLGKSDDDAAIEHKLADVYATLGEIAIEDDNYPQAAVDFESALKLKEKLLAKDDRLLSEANYMLALAYEFQGDSLEDKQKALKHMRAAWEVAKAAEVDAESVADLGARVKELEAEVADMASTGAARDAATDVAAGIGGRDAIKNLLAGMLTDANDISTLVKKNKEKKAEGKKRAAGEQGGDAKRQA